MKFFLLLLNIVFATRIYASGCMPEDIQLAEETPITSIGIFETNFNCNTNRSCGVSIYNHDTAEYHFLEILELSPETSGSTPFGYLEVKIYRQRFEGSCRTVHRYVIGLDINGKRFRSEKDLDY